MDFPEAISGFPVEDINIKVPTALIRCIIIGDGHEFIIFSILFIPLITKLYSHGRPPIHMLPSTEWAAWARGGPGIVGGRSWWGMGRRLAGRPGKWGVGFTISSLIFKIANVKDVPTSPGVIFLGPEPWNGKSWWKENRPDPLTRPDKPQKCLTVLAKLLQTSPPHLYP